MSDNLDAARVPLGQLAIRQGFITAGQLQEALTEQSIAVARGRSDWPLIGELLVARKHLTVENLNALLALQGAPSRNPAPPVKEHAVPTSFGKYTIGRKLGRGGMGSVYEALDTQLNRTVALKLLTANPYTAPEDLAGEEARFVQEARLSAKLKHANIVTIYEAGILEGRRYIAMEFVDGQTMSGWRKKEAASIRRQVEVLRDVARAAHHAHGHGILHRDLKPGNVLVDAQGHAYVTDFGLAKAMSAETGNSLTGVGVAVGTAAYMSPEQGRGLRAVDHRTDIYSLGVMLYEILTGVVPFQGESSIDILLSVVNDPVIAPLKFLQQAGVPAIDKEIERICLKAMAKDPEERYATAEAMAQDLTTWLQPAAPEPRKRPAWAFLAAGATVLLIVLAMALLSSRSSVTKDLEQTKAKMREALQGEIAAAYAAAEKAHKEAEAIAKAEAAATLRSERDRLGNERRAAEERARIAEEAAQKAASREPLAPLPPDDAWKRSIKLLPLIDPEKDSVMGQWHWEGDSLVSDELNEARIEIPFRPPEEYDLRVLFTRRRGNDSAVLILNQASRPFAWKMGGWGNTVFGFDVIRGALADNNPTTTRMDRCIENARVYVAVVQVRRNGMAAWLDGRPVTRWGTDYSDMTIEDFWRLRDDTLLGLGSLESPTSYHKIEILEVTGKGKRTRDAAKLALPASFKPVPVDPSMLKPGLIAEYFSGTAFNSLALRKIDAAVIFRWGSAPAWPDGPRDDFSCRWTGYLRVAKTAKYSITVTGNDGIRLSLDGTPVMDNWARRGEGHDAFMADLEEGYHAIAIEYCESARDASAVLAWAPEGGTKVDIGAGNYFHNPSGFKPLVALPFREPRALTGHSGPVRCLAFSPDGSTLASGSDDKTLRLWNVSTGGERGTPPPLQAALRAVSFSPSGKLLALGTVDRKVRLRDLEAGIEAWSVAAHSGSVRGLAFSPDGIILVSSSFDKTLRLWDTATGKRLLTLTGHEADVEAVLFTPDGKAIVSGSTDRTIRLWDPRTGKELRVFAVAPDGIRALALSPDGKILASGGRDDKAMLWDSASGNLLHTLTGHKGDVTTLAFSPDGKILASGSNDTLVRLWDVAAGIEVRAFPGHSAAVRSVAFSPDGRILASASDDATIKLWDVK